MLLFAIAETETSQTSARPSHSVNQLNTLEVYRLDERHVSDLNHTDPTTTFGPISTLDVDLAHKTTNADAIGMDTPATITKLSFVTHPAYDLDKQPPTDVIVGGVVATVAIIGLFVVIGLCVRRRRTPRASLQDTECPINPLVINSTPQNIDPHARGDKIIASYHTRTTSPISPLRSNVRPMFKSPLSSMDQGTHMFVSPPPVYETTAHEAQIYEIGSPSIRRNG
ncbi:hypothetical protein NW752_007005 [Fusarium irregulare]|uniref:Uncharacterized protein n=1 Tax=Fusarium irregulare TaxID=2494466 RepID=A0A9W8PRT4_9HYPO|nr:hypothetical protein NW766_005892 [Fusarium irregulare]KAJ4016069.1 hypothetical protein NW752_007005 [Fusarium irregulare]